MSHHRRDPNELNLVQQDAVHVENVRREMRDYKPYTNFNINPFTPMYTVTGKPNSISDANLDKEKEDEVMKKIIEMSHKPPTEKYLYPQTSSQEYGWIHTPLMQTDKTDMRLNHPRRLTDITETKEAEWKLKEQSENMN